MSDLLVYDMSEASEASPDIFVRKDWVSILDNQTRNYSGNQCIIDTSQLSNSNKYMNYREGYLFVPMVLTLTSQTAGSDFNVGAAAPGYALGLKNWFGSIVHSFSLDMQGTTIIQQTPFVGMYNAFRLMSSLSYADVVTQGAKIGFYPDDALAFASISTGAGNKSGKGICNNDTACAFPVTVGAAVGDKGNIGLVKRIQYWNFNPAAVTSAVGSQAYSALISPAQVTQLWKSYMFNSTASCLQFGISAQIMLKHLHCFFERVPLLKGTFFKLILNLNQSSVTLAATRTNDTTPILTMQATSVNSPLGGVSPIMIASAEDGSGLRNLLAAATGAASVFVASIAVGQTVLNSTQTSAPGNAIQSPIGGGSIQLVVPAYTMNPVYESAMLSSPVKKIVYEDVYQYTVANVAPNSPFTYLITNGIAGIKSVLVLPYYSASTNSVGTVTCAPFQSPFDPAGAGATSPLCMFTNFNVQISGQNAIYNVERYSWEQFANQLYGEKAVNGGGTDGLTSGLVGQLDFEAEYCYYYVNCGRCLSIEQSVPKAVNIIGQSMSAQALDLYVFISYSVQIDIDLLSGNRV